MVEEHEPENPKVEEEGSEEEEEGRRDRGAYVREDSLPFCFGVSASSALSFPPSRLAYLQSQVDMVMKANNYAGREEREGGWEEQREKELEGGGRIKSAEQWSLLICINVNKSMHVRDA